MIAIYLLGTGLLKKYDFIRKGGWGGECFPCFKNPADWPLMGDAETGAGAPLGGCLGSLCLPNRTPGWGWPSPSKGGCHSKWVHFHESTRPVSQRTHASPSIKLFCIQVSAAHTHICMHAYMQTHTYDTNTCTHVHVNTCTHIHMHAHRERHTCTAVFLH